MSGSPAAVEIDFFRIKDEEMSHNTDHRTSSRDIQGVISKINPELLKTAIAFASAKKQKTTNTFVKTTNTSSSWHPHLLLQTLPVYNNNNNKQEFCGNNNNVKSHNVAPLTIFYNGSVSVFDVSADQADKIMKLAENASPGSSKNGGGEVVNNNHQNNNINDNDNNGEELLRGVLAGRSDLPMLRKKSLRRFLEKRKERQVTINPYACSQGSEC